MSEFAGVQDQKLDAPDPNAPAYVDQNQWWYDMSQDEQAAYTAKKVAKLREMAAVVGVSSVSSNNQWCTPNNPDGINPALLAEYNRIIGQKGYAAKPIDTLKSDLEYHKSEVAKIETALSGFAGVQTTQA